VITGQKIKIRVMAVAFAVYVCKNRLRRFSRLAKLTYSRKCKCISEMTDEVQATTTIPVCCTYILPAFVLIVWARKAYSV